MFGINKNKILHTYLIVKVRKYKEQQPYFSLYTTPAIADETRARETVDKLNSLAELNKEDGWQEEYYCQHLTLQELKMKDKNKAILEYVIRWLDSNIDEDSTMSESIKEDSANLKEKIELAMSSENTAEDIDNGNF